jgi:hypothetical protein
LKTFTIQGQSYDYPESEESPQWGEQATSWAQAVTDALSTNSGPNDIPESLSVINNNQVAVANVDGLAFDSSRVRGAIVYYTVYRLTTGVGAQEAVETGIMFLGYKSVANTWDLVVIGSGGAGITFSMSAITSGQVQYVTTNYVPNTGYVGKCKFRALALAQI